MENVIINNSTNQITYSTNQIPNFQNNSEMLFVGNPMNSGENRGDSQNNITIQVTESVDDYNNRLINSGGEDSGYNGNCGESISGDESDDFKEELEVIITNLTNENKSLTKLVQELFKNTEQLNEKFERLQRDYNTLRNERNSAVSAVSAVGPVGGDASVPINSNSVVGGRSNMFFRMNYR